MRLFDIFKKRTVMSQDTPEKDNTLTMQSKTYTCVKCKKEITDAETYWRGNYRYCKTCGGAPKSTVNKNHIKFKQGEVYKTTDNDHKKSESNINKKYSNLVGHNDIRRILHILPEKQEGYDEKYYSIDMSNGTLCITDHSFAGGYGSGYYDFVDKLIRYHVPYDEFIRYCQNTSPILANIFNGIKKDNCFDYIKKIEECQRKLSRYFDVTTEQLRRTEFTIIETIRVYTDSCVYLCKKENAYMLVLEYIYNDSSTIYQSYGKLKDVELEEEDKALWQVYADAVINNVLYSQSVAQTSEHKFTPAIFKMKTHTGDRYEFTYTGQTRYSPNRSSTCGYGSDDWYYLCKDNDSYYLLEFTDNPSYGTAWMGIKLLDGDYEKLVEEDVNFWGQIAYSKEREKIYGLKLLDIDAVRELLPTYSRCNHFNDALYTG